MLRNIKVLTYIVSQHRNRPISCLGFHNSQALGVILQDLLVFFLHNRLQKRDLGTLRITERSERLSENVIGTRNSGLIT